MTTSVPLVDYVMTQNIATIILNRQEQCNAIDAKTTRAMHLVMDQFEADGDALVAILTGVGDRAFCSGMDLKAFAEGQGSAILEGPGGFAGFVSYPRTKPVIAAVNGVALAGGCEMVLACDLVVASEQAVFGHPEVKRGLYASAGGAFRLPRTIPRVRAMEILLTGDPIDAQTAFDLGLVNCVVPAERLMDTARELAQRICINAPLGVRETLALARKALDLSEEELWTINTKTWEKILSTEDASEGPSAFIEKRSPQWKGH